MFIFKWVAAAALLWGLFIGISYVITPVVTSGRGSLPFALFGIGLIVVSASGLLKLFARIR